MNASARTAVRLLGAAVLAGSVAVIVLNQRSLARERSENRALLHDQAEAAQLSAENAQLEKLLAENEAVQKLRVENHDLPKLRNEIHLRREAAAEAAKLRAENQRLGAAPGGMDGRAVSGLPADYVTRASLIEAGLATPEATVETFFHAMSQADFARAMHCFEREVKAPPSQEEQEEQQAKMQKDFAGFPGYRIAGKTVLGPDEVQLGIQSLPDGVIAPMKLKLIGGEWKIRQ